MAIFEIQGQDGAVYEVDAPDEATALKAFQGFTAPKQSGHANVPAFDPGVPGYNPSTGMVDKQPSMGEDVLLSARTGLRDAAEGTAGMMGDLPAAAMNIHRWIAEKLGASPEYLEEQARSASMINDANPFPTSQRVHDKTTEFVGPSYEPQTETGKVARTFGQFAPAALSPGSLTRRLTNVAAATAGKEGSERGAKALGFDDFAPYAGMAGAFFGGGLSSAAGNRDTLKAAAKTIGASAQDLTRIIKRMQQDGLTPDAINAKLKELGDQATLMDVGPNLRQEGQRIVAKGGDGRKTIDETLRIRDEGANARIRGEVDTNLGQATDPDLVMKGFKRAKKTVGREYDAAFAGASPIENVPLRQELVTARDGLVGPQRAAIESVIKDLEQAGNNPKLLHSVREAIDGVAQESANGKVRLSLGNARKLVDDELAARVPGVKTADARYADLSRQEEAYESGRTILDSGRNSPTPGQVGRQAANPKDQFRLAQGARAEIERIIGQNANDRVALQRIIRGEGDWNRDKLATLFGRDKADRVIAVLDREKTFAETSNKALYNSKTAETMSEGAGFSAGDAFKAGGFMGAVRSAAISLGDKALDKIRGQAAASRDANVAKMLSSQDRNKIVTALMKANGGKSVGQKQIEQAVKMLLLVPGSSAQFRGQVQ